MSENDAATGVPARIDASTWKHKFFGAREAQEILDMGPAAFAEDITENQPDDAQLFLVGIGFDLFINGFEEEGFALLDEAGKHFPDTKVGMIKSDLGTIRNCNENQRWARIGICSNWIYSEYNRSEG